MLDSMVSKKLKEAKILEFRLKNCQFAFALAVHPGVEAMPRRDRVLALKSLAHSGVPISVQVMVDHSMLCGRELLKATEGQELSNLQVTEITSTLSLWRGFAEVDGGVANLEEWTVEDPCFGALVALVEDQHKLMPPQKKGEYAQRDMEAD